jgi:hypothetical protein
VIAKDFRSKIATAGLEIEDQCSCHSKSPWYQLSHSTFRIFHSFFILPALPPYWPSSTGDLTPIQSLFAKTDFTVVSGVPISLFKQLS